MCSLFDTLIKYLESVSVYLMILSWTCIILDGVPNDPMVTSILTKHVFVFQLHNKAILYDQERGKDKDHCKCDYKSMCQCDSLVNLKPLDTGMEVVLKKHDAATRLGHMCPLFMYTTKDVD